LWGRYATVTGPTGELPKYTPPPTPTPTLTPTPAFYWEGEWSTVIAPEDAPIAIFYSMTITVDGKDFYAVVCSGSNCFMNATGIISDDNLSVSGTYSAFVDQTGAFELFALGTNQFQGNITQGTDVLGWCGDREGAGIPSPCMKP
jgi:hypothetical protein